MASSEFKVLSCIKCSIFLIKCTCSCFPVTILLGGTPQASRISPGGWNIHVEGIGMQMAEDHTDQFLSWFINS